jgi:murein DD-endopeptidase MepM/ murein hydrolase activator NlpD
LRDDRRDSGNGRARAGLRAALVTALALPVIWLVISESLARRLGGNRPMLVIIGLLAGTVAVSVVSTAPAGARSSATTAPIADRGFAPIPIPAPSARATDPDARIVGRLPSELPEITPAPERPTVVRFRPRDGWVGVSRLTAVSVRFSMPMEPTSTETAFHASVGETPINGTLRWAEGMTVLVLTPSSPLSDGAKVTLSVDISARAGNGLPLAEARSIAFTVQSKPPRAVRPAPPSSAWRWPLIGPITQYFGQSLTQYGVHNGIDIDGDTGDPVRAARRGRVVVAGVWDDCGGLQVHIDHGDSLVSWYRHLSHIDVETGDFVEAGTVIGRVGDTGCSLGSHLHFGIQKRSTFVDPLDYLPRR